MIFLLKIMFFIIDQRNLFVPRLELVHGLVILKQVRLLLWEEESLICPVWDLREMKSFLLPFVLWSFFNDMKDTSEILYESHLKQRFEKETFKLAA